MVRVVYACTHREEAAVVGSSQCCLGLLDLKLPHKLLHHVGAVYVAVGFVQYVGN